MSDSTFVDTNVLVYAVDDSEPEKRETCSGCQLLLSEDLNHGQRFGPVRVDNPFRAG